MILSYSNPIECPPGSWFLQVESWLKNDFQLRELIYKNILTGDSKAVLQNQWRITNYCLDWIVDVYLPQYWSEVQPWGLVHTCEECRNCRTASCGKACLTCPEKVGLEIKNIWQKIERHLTDVLAWLELLVLLVFC